MKNKFKKIMIAAAAVAVVSSGIAGISGISIFSEVVSAQDDWKAEFESICARTQDAMTISKDELKQLINRCDDLRPRIEKLDETQRKVYLKRLQMCRDLFAFVLESQEKK